MTYVLTLLVGLLLSGCTSSRGFDRTAMQALLNPGTGAGQTPDTPLVEKVSTPSPFRVALYFIQRNSSAYPTIRTAEWMGEDKDALANRLTFLRKEEIVKDTFLLVDPMIQGKDVPKIRQAASRHNADLVLILDGAAAVDRHNNGRAAWYATVIGAYLAEGTVSEALFIVEGDLWDVRTGRRLATQQTEGHAKSVGSMVLVEDEQVLAQAKKTALDEFSTGLIGELRRLKTERTSTNSRSQ